MTCRKALEDYRPGKDASEYFGRCPNKMTMFREFLGTIIDRLDETFKDRIASALVYSADLEDTYGLGLSFELDRDQYQITVWHTAADRTVFDLQWRYRELGELDESERRSDRGWIATSGFTRSLSNISVNELIGYLAGGPEALEPVSKKIQPGGFNGWDIFG